MSGLKRVLHEVHRRSVWQLLASYIVGAWLVLQITETLTSLIGLPLWFGAGVIALLVFGLVLVLTTGLVQVVAAYRSDPNRSYGALRRLFSWRHALAGGLVALAVLVAGTGAYMGLRAMGIGPVGSLVAAGVIDEREPVILSDFENNTTDQLLGRATTEAFRIDLSQSTAVTLVPAARVDRALALMRSDPRRALDERLAREVAVREGIKAVIAGDITPVGAGFVLTVRVVAAGDGSVLAATRQTADDSTRIIAAIDRLSKRLRERIGESLRGIQRSDPLDQVTTGSLEALRVYSQAVRLTEQGEQERAIALLDDAVALDTTFAMAWRKLGITLGNLMRDRSRQIEALTRAYQYRDRLSDRERLLTEGSYYNGVTGERDRAVAAYQALLDRYPHDTWALNNQAFILFEQRHYQGAARNFQSAIHYDSTNALFYGNAINALVALGEFDEAERVYQRLSQRFPEHPAALLDGVPLATARFDYGLAAERLKAVRERGTSNRRAQLGLEISQAQLHEIHGRLADASAVLEQTARSLEQQGDYAEYIRTSLRVALYDVILRGQPRSGIERLEEALARHPLETLDPLERPESDLALFYVLAGRPDKARPLLAAAEGRRDRMSDEVESDLAMTRSLLALDGGDIDEAIRQVRLADRDACAICALPAIGLVYDAAGQTDSVAAVYERYLDTPWLYRLADTDWWALAGVYERLAQIHQLRGDPEKAGQYHLRFIELWNDADPELQPRVEAARRAIEALSTDR